MVEDGGRGVAGDVDVGPAVVVVVEGGDGEAVVSGGLLEAAGFAEVFEFPVAEVVVEDVGGVVEAARAAHDGHAFPHAACGFSGRRNLGEIEVDVVGDGDVELAVAVVVDEGAASSPLLAGAGDSGCLRHFLKRPVAFVVVEAVEAVSSDVEVVVSVVVESPTQAPCPQAVAVSPALAVTSVNVPS